MLFKILVVAGAIICFRSLCHLLFSQVRLRQLGYLGVAWYRWALHFCFVHANGCEGLSSSDGASLRRQV